MNYKELSKVVDSVEVRYNFFPKTKEELKSLIESIIEQRGVDADLNDIDVSNVTNMAFLFQHSKFNGDISKWDVSNVTNMAWMFSYTEFNGDISKWDVSNVTTMSSMFYDSDFNSNISNWNVSNVVDMEYMFDRSPLSKNPPKWFSEQKLKSTQNQKKKSTSNAKFTKHSELYKIISEAIEEDAILSKVCRVFDDDGVYIRVDFSSVGWWLAELEESEVPADFVAAWKEIQEDGVNEDRWNPGTDVVEDILEEVLNKVGYSIDEEVGAASEYDEFSIVKL